MKCTTISYNQHGIHFITPMFLSFQHLSGLWCASSAEVFQGAIATSSELRGGCPLPTFTASVCIICRRVSFSSVHLCQCIGPIFADSGVNFLDVHCRWHLFLIDFLQSVPLSSSFFVLICPIQSRGSKAEEWGRSLVILYTRVRPACGKTLHHVSCVSHKHRTILS